MATKKQSAKTFESQLQELETIVEAMEEGDLPLEDALKQFEQGVKLTKNCQQLLEKAKQRIQVLSEQQELVDLDVDINEDEDAD
ncbi:exodeoxyribonuclease VII small subunit [Pleionea sediminis]|uniref:exodeoxyribonuclease VII small subunit n=1 Tax=Pleionea sediminis TaxID=2569479 RepID=UPI001186659C|nr:exodeoxyribonuclease VII small subunit [Pleionea sediminis]